MFTYISTTCRLFGYKFWVDKSVNTFCLPLIKFSWLSPNSFCEEYAQISVILLIVLWHWMDYLMTQGPWLQINPEIFDRKGFFESALNFHIHSISTSHLIVSFSLNSYGLQYWINGKCKWNAYIELFCSFQVHIFIQNISLLHLANPQVTQWPAESFRSISSFKIFFIFMPINNHEDIDQWTPNLDSKYASTSSTRFLLPGNCCHVKVDEIFENINFDLIVLYQGMLQLD